MKHIEISTGPQCPHCRTAKAQMARAGLDCLERDVSDPAQLEALRERLQRVRSLPQIFCDGVHICNEQDLKVWLGEVPG